jgi:hypothetical protein
MAPDAIDQFNAGLRGDKKLTKDIFTLVQDQKTQSLLDGLQKTLADISAKDYYTAEGVRDDQDFIENARSNMNLSGVVVGVEPRYGLIVHYTSQRFLPTDKGLYESRDDLDFDQLQNSALDVGTPVAVVHASSDGLWYYVMTTISDGWVKAKDVAIGDETQVKQFAQNNDFAVVIKPKADIFMNEGMTDYYDYARMGSRLPLTSVDAGRVTINVPGLDDNGNLVIKEAYMNAEDVNTGFLPFTARNVYKQALSMLNEPYGWGDMFGEQDCSRFLQMVFATMGLELPRDSKDQARISSIVVIFDDRAKDADKTAAIINTLPAITFLVLKGHIMLYLGAVDGKPYAIHETTTLGVDRVIISDLMLGEGSPKGSLLKRLIRTVTIE